MPLPDPTDHADLVSAKESLESSNWLIDLANFAGKPIEAVLNNLPKKAGDIIEKATVSALNGALTLALSTMDKKSARPSSTWWHRAAATVTGAAGGAFGLPALAVELPLSTTVILRSIADVARAEGEDLRSPESRLACLEVFALGGKSPSDDATDSSYFAVRAALSKSVSETATYVLEKGAAEESAPVVLRLIQQIAKRFAPAVADKAAAQAAPLLGAIGGATVNLIFLHHFQRVADGHFTIRRLERKYGQPRVREEYNLLPHSR